MRVIGVVDLQGGQAVHARAGRRELYEPIHEVAGLAIRPGDALALAHVYLDRLDIRELYVADLDAIRGGRPQGALVAAIAELGVPLWLDAGAASVDGARLGVTSGAGQIVVGLETLRSFGALAAICAALGGERVAFSLDLRGGEPVVAPGAEDIAGDAASLAVRAAAAGARTIILLDLARVGTGSGIDRAVLADVRGAVRDVTLLAGGGVCGVEDLRALEEGGCGGALVASALLDGRLGRADVARARGDQPSVSR